VLSGSSARFAGRRIVDGHRDKRNIAFLHRDPSTGVDRKTVQCAMPEAQRVALRYGVRLMSVENFARQSLR